MSLGLFMFLLYVGALRSNRRYVLALYNWKELTLSMRATPPLRGSACIHTQCLFWAGGWEQKIKSQTKSCECHFWAGGREQKRR